MHFYIIFFLAFLLRSFVGYGGCPDLLNRLNFPGKIFYAPDNLPYTIPEPRCNCGASINLGGDQSFSKFSGPKINEVIASEGQTSTTYANKKQMLMVMWDERSDKWRPAFIQEVAVLMKKIQNWAIEESVIVFRDHLDNNKLKKFQIERTADGLVFFGSPEAFTEVQKAVSPAAWRTIMSFRVGDIVQVYSTVRKAIIELEFGGFSLIPIDGIPVLHLSYIDRGAPIPKLKHSPRFNLDTIKLARNTLTGFPNNRHFTMWKNHVEFLLKQFDVKPENTFQIMSQLRIRSNKLEADLQNIAKELKTAIDQSPDALYSEARTLDSSLEKALIALKNPSLLEGTGYKSGEDFELTMGAGSDITGWVASIQDVFQASQALGRKAEMAVGRLILCALYQVGVPQHTPLTFEDKNWRALYFEKIVIDFEEHLHVVQHLRVFASHLAGNPEGSKEDNISQWARSKDSPAMVDTEADVFAKLQELFGPLDRIYRSRYASREYAP